MSDPVKPITSEYQSPPWQPTVDTSASDAGDEKSAAEQYDKVYGGSYTTTTTSSSSTSSTTYVELPSPTMSMSYTTAPDLIPVANTSSGSGSSTAQLADAFSIQLGDLMSAEQACLDACNASVQGYQTLSSVVNAAMNSSSIFGQIVGSYQNPGDGKASILAKNDGLTYDSLDSEGTSFAAAVNPQMQQLLETIGNTIEAMGQFTALLNNAGQMYTDTDAQSAFPSPQQVQADATRGPRLPSFDMDNGPNSGPRVPTFDLNPPQGPSS